MQKIFDDRTKFILDYYGERIIDSYHCQKFSEFVIRRGGDILTFRVYGVNHDNFMITER